MGTPLSEPCMYVQSCYSKDVCPPSHASRSGIQVALLVCSYVVTHSWSHLHFSCTSRVPPSSSVCCGLRRTMPFKLVKEGQQALITQTNRATRVARPFPLFIDTVVSMLYCATPVLRNRGKGLAMHTNIRRTMGYARLLASCRWTSKG